MTAWIKAGLTFTAIACSAVACVDERPLTIAALAEDDVESVRLAVSIEQYLTNDAPLGPGVPQASDHCPSGPGRWIAGSGRSTATSSPFGDLTEVEVYCINVDRSELAGGLATWLDADGDSISMAFSARLLEGFVYATAPRAPMVGVARFTGGSGKWSGLTGAAFLTGRQNGDGTATIRYEGTVYVPR